MHCDLPLRSGRPFFFLVLLAMAVTGPAAKAATYTVGAGRSFASPDQIVWSEIRPGDTIIIYPGTYPALSGTGNSMIISGVSGTAAQRITIRGSGETNLPLLTGGVLVTNGSRYIDILALDVSRNPLTQPYAAVIVRTKSSNILLSDLSVHGSFVGVAFNQAGLENTIQFSRIFGNTKHGITADAPDTSFVPDANHPSVMYHNTIENNGEHGIEVTGPYWTIEKNTILHNGTAGGGTSGIHLYSVTDASGIYTCNYNRVVYNYVGLQQDSSAADGNGIQIDDFCDFNTVAFNVTWGNAGAGISVLNGQGNSIIANTSFSNAQDTSRAKKFPGVFRGEIIVGSMASLCSNSNVLPAKCREPAGGSSGNIIYDNIVVSNQSTVPGIFVSADAVSRNTNHFYPNMYYNLGTTGPGIEMLWDDTPYYSATTIDSVTKLSSPIGNLVEKPDFIDTAAPAADGLRLATTPAHRGWPIPSAEPDIRGEPPGPTSNYFGAYYQ